MKALVLSGGTGTRLRPFTSTTTKQLLPVANKPILFYIMDMVKEAGINDIGVIVSTEWAEHVEQALGNGSRWQAKFTYIPQSKPAGLAHAVKLARNFLGDSPFMMVLGDNIYKCNIKEFIAQFRNCATDALLLVKPVDDPSAFGIVECKTGGEVVCLKEKPKQTSSNLACAGIYLFSPAIHEAIDRTKPSWRNELEITDAIQKLVEMERNVLVHILDGWWVDTGDKDDLLRANRFVLEEFLEHDIDGRVDGSSRVQGKVKIGRGAVIESSLIRGPVAIAEDCLIKGCVLGPFTSIGAGSEISESNIENTIVLKDSLILKVKHLAGSIIGNRVEVTGKSGAEARRLFLADDTRLEI